MSHPPSNVNPTPSTTGAPDMSTMEVVPAPQPLVSRQAMRQPVVAPPPQGALAVFKPENIQMAESMAKAGMLGPQYNNKPGACLLLLDWATRYDVALFEVPGAVSFRDGKITVSGRMQKKLAARRGYRAVKVHGDEQSCTVAVIGPDGVEVNGEGNGRFTYTIDLATRLGLVAKNDNYKKDPAQMLYWRALTRALDQYGPDELSGVFVDEYPEFDPAEMAEANAIARGEGWPPVEPDPSTEPFLDAPSVEVTPAPTPEASVEEREAFLFAAASAKGKTKNNLVKWARDNGHETTVTDWGSLLASPDAYDAVADWLGHL